ncbi:MAG: hypothetical protein ACP6IS_08590 [Candidatus Asgardarchaeia archaeon]
MKKIEIMKVLTLIILVLGYTFLVYTYYVTPKTITYKRIVEEKSEKLDIMFNRTIENLIALDTGYRNISTFSPFRDSNDTDVSIHRLSNGHILIYFDLTFKVPKGWSSVIIYFKRIYFTPYGNFETTINMSSYLISEKNNFNVSLDPFPTLYPNTHVGAGIRLIRAVEANFTFRNYFKNNITIYPALNRTLTMKPGNYTLRQIIRVERVEAINLTRKAILELIFMSSVRVWQEFDVSLFGNYLAMLFYSSMLFLTLGVILVFMNYLVSPKETKS